jgi:hypothetical protein
MAKQTVFLGSEANDSTGTPLREAFDMINDNFDEVYGNNFVTNAMLNDDIVDHAELANRYTSKVTSSSTGTQNLDASTASVFLMTGAMSTATLTIQNLKLGQTIDIVFFGSMASAVLTLDTNYTTDNFYRVGDTELDQAEPNIVQVTCVDDTDSSARLAYSINKFTAGDDTP